MARALVVVAIVLVAACSMGADKWSVGTLTASYVELPENMGMTSCPAGDGPAFEHVRVIMRHHTDDPMPGMPSTLFTFDVDGDVTITAVDEETDDNGMIRFSMVANETIVRLGDEWLHVRCRVDNGRLADVDSLRVNTFDLNADGCVDDKDVAIFQSLYLSEDPRADYFQDGVVDMKDLSVLVDHDGHCVKEEELDPTQLPAPDKMIKVEPPVRKIPIADDED